MEEVDDAAARAAITVVRMVAGTTVPTVAVGISWAICHDHGWCLGVFAARSPPRLTWMPRGCHVAPLGRRIEVGVHFGPVQPGQHRDMARTNQGEVCRMSGGPSRLGSGMEYRTGWSCVRLHPLSRSFVLSHVGDGTQPSSVMNPWIPHELRSGHPACLRSVTACVATEFGT